MFKLLFKIIGSIILVIALIVGVAIWKGGEPFRWIGDGMIIIGEAINKVGNTIDEIKQGQKKAAKKIVELKESLDSIQGMITKEDKKQSVVRQGALSDNKDGTVNKN